MEESLTFQTLDRKLGDHAPFLMSLSDDMEEELRLVIAAGEISEDGGRLPDFADLEKPVRDALHGILADTKLIEPNEGRAYEICFHNYIMYQVRNESYSDWDPEEIRHGRYLILFGKSKLLSYLGEFTIAQRFDDGSCYPGQWKHYGIYTQSHIIDVIAHEEPEITRKSQGPDA